MNKLRKISMDGARRFIENERKMNEMYRKKNGITYGVLRPKKEVPIYQRGALLKSKKKK